MITKILEVLSNALSVISNFTSNIVVKIVIIIIILGAWIFKYAKKSTSKAISAVMVMVWEERFWRMVNSLKIKRMLLV